MVNISVLAINSNTLLEDSYGVYLVDATGGNITVTLMDITSYDGVLLKIKRVDSSGNTVTVDTSNSQTIDDATSKTLMAGGELQVVSLNDNWFTIAMWSNTGATGTYLRSTGLQSTPVWNSPAIVPQLRAIATGAQSYTATTQVVDLKTVIYDTVSEYNTTNSEYLIPITGVYIISGIIQISPVSTATASLGIYVNGTVYAESAVSTIGPQGIPIATQGRFTASDSITLRATLSSSETGIQYGSYAGNNIYAELNIAYQPATYMT